MFFCFGFQLSNEKKTGCLGYIWGLYYPVIYGDYNKPLQGSLLNNPDSMESKRLFLFRDSPHYILPLRGTFNGTSSKRSEANHHYQLTERVPIGVRKPHPVTVAMARSERGCLRCFTPSHRKLCIYKLIYIYPGSLFVDYFLNGFSSV